MTYDEFKTYLTTFLWKVGDTALTNNLDDLITMGTQELNRRLDLSRRNTPLADISVTSSMMDLPTDFRQMIYIGDSNCGYADVTLWTLQNTPKYTGGIAPLYHTSGGKLYTRGDDSVYPVTLQMQYRTNLPDYQTDDASWMADEFLDVYTYTVLKHTAPFLREDERIAVWAQFSEAGIATMIEEDRHNVEFGGSPLTLNIERFVP